MPDIKIKKLVMPDGLSGLYYKNEIHINANLNYQESVEVLSEEIGHYYTSVGDITDYGDIQSAKQEVKARRFGYELIITLDAIIDCWRMNLRTMYEIAEHFEVTPKYVMKAIEHYKMKYGLSTLYGDYLIRFDPLNVYEYKKI